MITKIKGSGKGYKKRPINTAIARYLINVMHNCTKLFQLSPRYIMIDVIMAKNALIAFFTGMKNHFERIEGSTFLSSSGFFSSSLLYFLS